MLETVELGQVWDSTAVLGTGVPDSWEGQIESSEPAAGGAALLGTAALHCLRAPDGGSVQQVMIQ